VSMRKLNLVVVLAVCVVTAAFGLALVRPGLAELKACEDQVAAEQTKVQQTQDELGSISGLYASILRLDEEVRDFRLRLPAERRFGEFLSELSQCLEESAVTDYAVQPKPVLAVVDPNLPASLRLAAGSNILPVNVSFRGTFSQVFTFLSNVESLPRLVRVESFRLVNDENRPGKVKVDMTLHTYQYASDHPGWGAGR